MKKDSRQPRLVVLSSPSGGGKTTLCRMLLDEFPEKMALSTSATTRPRRPKEKDGQDYFFLSKKDFLSKRENGEFVEWAEVHGHFYGTPRSNIDNALASGKHMLFDIDVQGAKSLKQAYPDHILLIFILPPSMEELEKRLRERQGDSAEAIETRLQNAYNELGWSRIFHYQITNNSLPRAYEELKGIVKKECR